MSPDLNEFELSGLKGNQRLIAHQAGANTVSSSKKPEKRSGWLNRNVLGLGLTSLFSDWSHEMTTAVLPLFLASIGSSAAALGLIEGIADMVSSLIQMWAGHHTDRTGKRKPLTVAGYVMTSCKFLFAFATNWYEVLFIRTFAWFGRGMRGPLRDAMLVDAAPKEAYGRVFGFHRAMDTAGAVLGPLTALLLMRLLGHSTSAFRTIFLVSLIPGVFAVAAIWGMVKEQRRTNVQALKFRAAVYALPGRFRWFTAAVGVFGFGNFAHSLLILRASQLLTPTWGVLAAGTAAVALYTLHNVLYAGVSYPAGALADRIGKRPLLMVGYALFGLMSLGFIWVDRSLPMLIVLFVLAGVYIALVDSMQGAMAADLLPEELRGTGFGVLSTVNSIGDFVSSFTVGFLWAKVSPTAGFGYAAILSLLGAVMLFALRNKGNATPLPVAPMD
jgi:MFS family permease